MPTPSELVNSFHDLSASLLDPLPYSEGYRAVAHEEALKRRSHSGFAVRSFMDKDKEQLEAFSKELIAIFEKVQATYVSQYKVRELQPLKAAVLHAFDQVAAATLKTRDEHVQRAAIGNNTIESYGANREQLRRGLTADMDVVLGRDDAVSERDRGVQRRALRTSLVVSACGVLLSAIVSYGMARRNDAVNESARHSDRRFALRESLRGRVGPHMENVEKLASYIDFYYHRAGERDSLKRLVVEYHRAAAEVDSLGDRTADEVAYAFSDSIADEYFEAYADITAFTGYLDSLMGVGGARSGIYAERFRPIVEQSVRRTGADGPSNRLTAISRIAGDLRRHMFEFDRSR